MDTKKDEKQAVGSQNFKMDEAKRQQLNAVYGPRFAELFFIAIHQPLDYGGNGQPSIVAGGMTNISFDSFYSAMAKFLTENSTHNVSPDNLKELVLRIQETDPTYIKPVINRDKREVVLFSEPRGASARTRLLEINKEVGRQTPGGPNVDQPYCPTLAKYFVEHSNIGVVKPLSRAAK